MTLTGYDAAYPPVDPPETDVVAFYGGGDTPHVWTPAQIVAQKARYRLPIWVRSNPAGADAAADADAFVTWLRGIQCPEGSCTVLDLETAVDPAYVNAFAEVMHEADYKVLPYGSGSTLFHNPQVDGYWVAKLGPPEIPPGYVGVQYTEGDVIDLDLFLASLDLWDTQPAPKPDPLPPLPPPVNYPGEDMTQTPIRVSISGGLGWYPTPAGLGPIISVVMQDVNPQDNDGHGANLPIFVGVAGQTGPNSPDGTLNFKGGADGVYGATIFSVG